MAIPVSASLVISTVGSRVLGWAATLVSTNELLIVLKLAASKGRIKGCFRREAGSTDIDRRVSCVDESRVYFILRIPPDE